MNRLRAAALAAVPLIGSPGPGLALDLPPAPSIGARLLVVVLVALAATVLAGPYFYYRNLRKRRVRSLRGFLLDDPRTREILVSKSTPPETPPEPSPPQPS